MVFTSRKLIQQIYPKYSFNFKLLITFSHYFLFIVYGLLDSLPSIVLTDLAYLMKMDMATAARGLTTKGISYAIGAVICSNLFRKVDRRLGVIISLLTSAICISSLPFLHEIGLFFSLMFILGLVDSAFDVAVNSLLLDLWGNDCNTYMQALHACYGIGQFLAPFCAAQFLGLQPRSANETANQVANKLFLHFGDPDVEINKYKSLTGFRLVFIFSSIAIVLSASCQIVLLIVENRKISRIISTAKEDKEQDDDDHVIESSAVDTHNNNINENEALKSHSQESTGDEKMIFYLGFIILLVYVGLEINTFSFVIQFITYLHPKEDKIVEKAAHQVTIMSGAFAFCRVIGIFVSRFLESEKMVIMHLSILSISSILLLFSQIDYIFIPIGLFLLGVGCSAVFASIYSMIEQRCKLTKARIAINMFAGSISTLLFSAIVPNFLEKYPMIFVYNIVISVFIVYLCVIAFLSWTRKANQ